MWLQTFKYDSKICSLFFIRTKFNTTGSFTRLTNVVQNYAIIYPTGFMNSLNPSVSRELEIPGEKMNQMYYLLSPDEATNKVEVRFYYDSVSIDFTQPTLQRKY